MAKKRGSKGKSRRPDVTGELDDQRLSQVSGGGGGVPGVEAIEAEGIVSPRDSASGLATGKRQHKPTPGNISFEHYFDKSSP